MAKEELKNIFLSASIPLAERHPDYFETADVIAIRDAVIALARTVLPKYRLIWGGHPSITPIINHVIERLGLDVRDRVTIYQSEFFADKFPKDNNKFENVIHIPSSGGRDSSLISMRTRMFTDQQFHAGVFVGGMKGVEDEYSLFREYQQNAIILPLASTGAAARRIYFYSNKPDDRFVRDYAYTSLFNDYIIKP